MKKIYRNKVLGSMIGGAVGDALGYPVEFMSYAQIVTKYGERGIHRYDLNKNGEAEISDDTQMSLFTANGVLFTFTRYAVKETILASPHSYIKDSYIEWFETQTGDIDYSRPHYNWIRDVRDLHVRRAPGHTCLSALQCEKNHGQVKNESKGCGGVMRTAPLALYTANPSMFHPSDMLNFAKESAEIAAITHKHPLGYLPSAYLHLMLHKLLQYAYVTWDAVKSMMEECMALMTSLYPDQKKHLIYMKELLDKASLLAKQNLCDEEAIRQIGQGWVAEEALAIALYCVLKYPGDFEKAVVASVNHSGDSDSTGTLTGNIMGAIVGYDAIPQYYKDNLELRWLIEEIAEDIATGLALSDKKWRDKYIYPMFDCPPFDNSYLVSSGLKIFAGEYPGDIAKMGPHILLKGNFSDFKYFYDLTYEGELPPYSRYLDPDMVYVNYPLHDCDVPVDTRSVAKLIEMIIRNASSSPHNEFMKSYIHCRGGVGRTGTIVACLYAYLLKGEGLSAEEIYNKAMKQLADSFSRCPKSKYRTSPDNALQRDFVRQFVVNECV